MPVQVENLPFSKEGLVHTFTLPLQVGVITGIGGLISGGFAGILISAHPVLFSSVAGIQCFSLGFSFSLFRGVLIQRFASGRPSRSQELKYSTIAGAMSGAINGALRSRSNIIPGSIMMGLLGLAGQTGFHAIPRFYNPDEERQPLLQKLAETRWMPLKALSDEDYENMLNEKLLKTEAEIAAIDEKILSLQVSQSKDHPRTDVGREHTS